MNAYRIRKLGELWQLLSPIDGSCIGVCEELSLMVPAACKLAESRGSEVHLFGDAERLDAVFMNFSPRLVVDVEDSERVLAYFVQEGPASNTRTTYCYALEIDQGGPPNAD